MRAYITLLSTDSYLDGVLGLHGSLQMVGSKYPLVVVVTKNVSLDCRKILQKLNIEMIEVAEFEYTDKVKSSFAKKNMPHWSYTSNKLRIFGFTQFEKLIMLDADMMIIKNIDHLFEAPAWSATEDSPMTADPLKKNRSNLNSGLLVVEPKEGLDEELIAICQQEGTQDQDAIRFYKSNWIQETELHLPQKYNLFARFFKDYVKAGIPLEDFCVIHFIGKIKPFQENAAERIDPYYDYFRSLYLNLIREQYEKIDFLSFL